ncbi:hypothetical protein VPH35_122203 [Triticum aestivum]|uniref:Uncharacterized protein n=1 Tax=Triticum urartu TaxID=4572 RepID=A0A8R7QX49_TRIUA
MTGQYPAATSEPPPCLPLLPALFFWYLSLIHWNPCAVPALTFFSPVAAAALVFSTPPFLPSPPPLPPPRARGLGSAPVSHWSAHDVPNELLRCMPATTKGTTVDEQTLLT